MSAAELQVIKDALQTELDGVEMVGKIYSNPDGGSILSFTPTTDGFDWNRVKDLTDMAETAITIGTVTPSDPHVGTEVYVNGKSWSSATRWYDVKKG